MKKIFAVLIAAALFASCGGAGTKADATKDTLKKANTTKVDTIAKKVDTLKKVDTTKKVKEVSKKDLKK